MSCYALFHQTSLVQSIKKCLKLHGLLDRIGPVHNLDMVKRPKGSAAGRASKHKKAKPNCHEGMNVTFGSSHRQPPCEGNL